MVSSVQVGRVVSSSCFCLQRAASYVLSRHDCGLLTHRLFCQFWLHITACSRRTSSPILQNLVFGTHTPLTAASTLTKSKLCADHPCAQIIHSSGALRTHNEKPNGGAMPPGYSSRDDRCGTVRVAA